MLTVQYERHTRAALVIDLGLLDGSRMRFTSNDVWDLALLRFAALARSNERPELSGFYPLVLPAG